MNDTFVRSYADCQALWRTCRNKANGKPIRSWVRMQLDGDVFRFGWANSAGYIFDPIFTIHPDNTLQFNTEPGSSTFMSQSLVVILSRAFPFVLRREKTGVYNVMHFRELGKELFGHIYVTSAEEKVVAREGHTLFKGLRYDLHSGTPINPKPDPQKIPENPDKRSEWRARLKAARTNLKVVVRLGALHNFEDTTLHVRPDFDVFYEFITTGHMSADMMGMIRHAAFHYTAESFWVNTPDVQKPERIMRGYNNMLSRFRNCMKEKFGVYENG